MTVIVRHEDLRALNYCNKGARSFFAAHGLDWQLFMEQGVEARILLETGDSMAAAAVEEAKRRQGISDGQQ